MRKSPVLSPHHVAIRELAVGQQRLNKEMQSRVSGQADGHAVLEEKEMGRHHRAETAQSIEKPMKPGSRRGRRDLTVDVGDNNTPIIPIPVPSPVDTVTDQTSTVHKTFAAASAGIIRWLRGALERLHPRKWGSFHAEILALAVAMPLNTLLERWCINCLMPLHLSARSPWRLAMTMLVRGI